MNVSERRRLANVKERLQRNDCAGALRILQPLLPRKATAKAKATRARKRADTAAKIAKRRMSTAELRASCMTLGGGFCECGCGRPFDEDGFARKPELDHYFGRVGPQSVATCWILTRLCHWQKTHNEPDTATWNIKFLDRCQRNGLPVPKALRVEHAPVPAPQAPESPSVVHDPVRRPNVG